MLDLARDRQRRARMGAQAQAYVREAHAPAVAADAYIAAIGQILKGIGADA